MRRREFIKTISGAAVAWPLAAVAQQPKVWRIGVLHGPFFADDPIAQKYDLVFAETLAQLGWIEGLNVRIDFRWGGGDPDRIRQSAADLIALAPDVILAVTSAATGRLLQSARAVPIVFVLVGDPVVAGFVESLARPGGNATGFMMFEYSIGGKWLELLKEIAPGVKRVGFLQDPAVAVGPGQFGAIQASASSAGVEARPISARDAAEIERGITAFARSANGGLIVAGGTPLVHRNVVITLAARHRLPALYADLDFVTDGGLIGYGPDRVDEFRRAATYVDRILKGAKPADLPVQAPTKYELAINLKTARAIGLDVPASVLARADVVIE